MWWWLELHAWSCEPYGKEVAVMCAYISIYLLRLEDHWCFSFPLFPDYGLGLCIVNLQSSLPCPVMGCQASPLCGRQPICFEQWHKWQRSTSIWLAVYQSNSTRSSKRWCLKCKH